MLGATDEWNEITLFYIYAENLSDFVDHDHSVSVGVSSRYKADLVCDLLAVNQRCR